MEKIEETYETVESYTHVFYCDGCNKYLGTTKECDDGWYDEIGDFELRVHILDEWYTLTKHFCDDCKDTFITDLKAKLKNIGFEKGF